MTELVKERFGSENSIDKSKFISRDFDSHSKMNTLKPPADSPSINSNWQMEILMEKLRSKATSLRSIPESAKNIKQAILNKQHMMDTAEKSSLTQSLDKLQQNIKVSSLPAMIERLEACAKQLGLTFTAGTSGPEVYISCDMFYVEVLLQNEGRVRDVKVELAGDQNEPRGQSSPELVECLSKSDFNDFSAHLEGFLSIYQLNTEKKNKCKAYQALQALEIDLVKLFEMAQDTITDTSRLLLKSPVGFLMKRRGGHPMRLIYFISPYELLDVSAGKSISLTHDIISTRDLSHFVNVTIEGSTSHKVQTTTLVNIKKGVADGLKLPSISGLTTANSVTLPACFCLKLNKTMIMSVELAQKISDITNSVCYEASAKEPLLPLVIRQESDINIDSNNNRGLFVTLPDQQHCYFLTNGCDFYGVPINRIFFTHPTSIAHILECLRMQALFNTLISSCIRPDSKHDMDSAFTFEVTALSHECISVTFEHPQEESTATAELDLSDVSNVKCRLHTLNRDTSLCSDEYATKVLQRCLSIPVTMRAVMRKIIKEEKKETMMQGDTVNLLGRPNHTAPDQNQNTTVHNAKLLLADYNTMGMRLDHPFPAQLGAVSMAPESTNSNSSGVINSSDAPSMNHIKGNLGSASGTPMNNNGLLEQHGFGPIMQGIQKNSLQHHFLVDGKASKVRKRKPITESDNTLKSESDDMMEMNEKNSSDSIGGDNAMVITSPIRRDIKIEKVQNVMNKRRSSTDGGISSEPSELAALREKVYGAGSAANFAKFNYVHNKDVKNIKQDQKKFKKQKSEGETRKLPIVLDLTDSETAKKNVSGSGVTSQSSSLSAALLKRPGIEIIPIPGSNTPISIPSSITVTPVVRSIDDKQKDKDKRKDKKDIEKKDKKRRREDSPVRTSISTVTTCTTTSSNISSTTSTTSINTVAAPKSSRLQIISTNTKNSAMSTFEKVKNETKSLSGISVKPNSNLPFQSPTKKVALSPTMSKSITQGKLSFSPTHSKPNKPIYSPHSSSSQITSPKSGSPKQGGSGGSSSSPKHSSIGKPSMNAMKTTSPTFPKPSLSPKTNKSKEKERSSSISPSRPSSSPIPITPSLTSKSTKSLSLSVDKIKNNFSEALTITKVLPQEVNVAVSSRSNTPTSASTASLLDKLSVDKAKASPPKNRKGTSLNDIVSKLTFRAEATGPSDSVTIVEKTNKRDPSKLGPDGKKEENFTIRSGAGLKVTINKGRSKDGTKSSSSSSSPNSRMSKSASGLKPGVMSAPASKKGSMAGLPALSKISSNSSSVAPSLSMSPVVNCVNIPLFGSSQYQREKTKENKERERSDKLKREQLATSKSSGISGYDSRKESSDKNIIEKSHTQKNFQKSKDDSRFYTQTFSKLDNADAVDRAMKSMFGEDDISQMDSNGAMSAKSFFERSKVKSDLTKHIPTSYRDANVGLADSSINSEDSSSNFNPFSHMMGCPMPPPQAPLNNQREKIDEVIRDKQRMNQSSIPPSSLAPSLASIVSSISNLVTHSPTAKSSSRSHSPTQSFAPSPVVSIKIVKSPAPVASPLNLISPQHSPCLIDEELMDEALRGP